jgi:hypothetical protein
MGPLTSAQVEAVPAGQARNCDAPSRQAASSVARANNLHQARPATCLAAVPMPRLSALRTRLTSTARSSACAVGMGLRAAGAGCTADEARPGSQALYSALS